MDTQKQKLSRRMMALLELGAAAIVIGVLIYLQLISVLYVLATVSLVILLLVVAFANLEKVGVDGGDGFSRDLN